MKVLGFRGDPKAPRYAVVAEVGGACILHNASTDNKLSVPASIDDDAEDQRLCWLYGEILRIFDDHPDLTKVLVKANEFTRMDSKPKRKSAYIDAAVMLACAHRNIPVEVKVYSSMGATKARTRDLAEQRVGRTDKYRDDKMADAVNVAWWGLHHK